MNIEFDPDYIAVCMRLWRDTTDMKVELHDEFKLHFMSNRGTILRNFENTASAWSMMLSHMTPVAGGDVEKFAELVAQVAEFKQWVKAEQQKLDRMAIEEEIQDGIAELLNDPATREAIRKLVGPRRGSKKS
jgi:hypothetical protein